MELHWNATPHREWERLADSAGAGLQQRWAYGEAVRAMGGKVDRVSITLGGQTLAVAQVLRRGFLALVTRGPVWTQPPGPDLRSQSIRALRQGLRSRGARLQAFTMADASADIAGLAVMTPATVACLPLPISRVAMHGKWRNRLTAAERLGLDVTRLPNRYDRISWLVEADRAQQRRRGYRALPPGFTASWLAEDRCGALTLTADRGGDPIAAMMFLRHGLTATYHIGWSSAEGRAAHAHNLLLWRAAEKLAAKGVRLLDLGTLDTVGAPGLARFKLGTGAEAMRLGATWITV